MALIDSSSSLTGNRSVQDDTATVESTDGTIPLLLQSLRRKLARGDELAATDLRPLQLLHNDTSIDYLDRSFLNRGGIVSPTSASPSSMKDDVRSDSDSNCVAGGWVCDPHLVRYVGMVQDMLDPEYYPSLVHGKSAHFRDWNPSWGGVDNDTQQPEDGPLPLLAERVPLVMVPIPFASQWLSSRGGKVSGGTKSSTSNNVVAGSPTSVVAVVPPTPEENRKRGREDHIQDDPKQSKSEIHHHTHNHMNVDDGRVDGAEPMEGMYGEDWWPAGTCGTSVGDCPVLAKLCYDQLFRSDEDKTITTSSGSTTTVAEQMDGQEAPRPDQQRRLRLNDIVSLVGVLSVNPWEADFPGQRQVDDESKGLACYFEVDSSSFAPRLPPPSRLPRLHVMSYKVLDLDELAARTLTLQKEEIQPEPTEGHLMSMVVDDDEDDAQNDSNAFPPFIVPPPMAQALMAGCDPIVTQALWMCLLSRAERRKDHHHAPDTTDDSGETFYSMVRVGPMERALGCLSLQISTPDLSTSRSCFQHLATKVLPALCPVVATVEFIGDRFSFSSTDMVAPTMVAPTRDEDGRLRPSPLQLPAGSVVLVHYHPTVSVTSNTTAVDDGTNHDATKALYEMVQHHRLPYTFEGNVVLPFEADYRVIVVTTQTQQLPATLTVLTKGRNWTQPVRTGSDRGDHPADLTTPSSTIVALRKALAVARTRGNSSNGNNDCIKLTPSLLERAQQDFLERRQQQNNTSTMGCVGIRRRHLPGEDDFHRWLTLTKLQVKSRWTIRRVSLNDDKDMDEQEDWVATVEDWQAALQLDDIIRGMD